MPALQRDIIIEQGATYSETFAVGADYALWTPRAKLRSSYALRGYGSWFPTTEAPPGILVATFTAAITSGTVTLSLDAITTGAIQRPPWARRDEVRIRIGWYDLELVNGAQIYRAWRGAALLDATITQQS